MYDQTVLEEMATERGVTADELAGLLCVCPEGCPEDPCLDYCSRVAAATEEKEERPTRGHLPDDDKERLEYPMFDGLLAYFPAALAEVARVSKIGNDQHNPGQPLHWARSKSTDHENKILRHLVDSGKKDSKGVRHSARLAWRALALLQVELEREEGAPLPRNAKY